MMPYTDGGERIDTPGVPYQPVPLETGDMKPPLMPGARPVDDRTVAEVMKQQCSVIGCCERHADNMGCDCLSEAKAREKAARPLRLGAETAALPPAPETLDCPCPSCMAAKEAVEAEREACARLVESLCATLINASKGPVPGYLLDQLSRAIRARG